MTTTTPVALLKSQLNIDHDHDDDLLAHKLAAAEDWIGNYIDNGFSFAHYNGGAPSLTEAALQLASFWYEQREGAFEGSIKAIPFGVRDLLESHKEQVTGYDKA